MNRVKAVVKSLKKTRCQTTVGSRFNKISCDSCDHLRMTMIILKCELTSKAFQYFIKCDLKRLKLSYCLKILKEFSMQQSVRKRPKP